MGPIFTLTQATNGTITNGALAGFEQMIGAVGMLFVLFLVVATVSEQILEMFRGVLEQAGIKALKGGVSVTDAQKRLAEFLPVESPVLARANSLLTVATDYPKQLAAKRDAIIAVRDNIAVALGPNVTNITSAALKSQLSALTTYVNAAVSKYENRRIMILRFLSFLICFAICFAAKFDAFALVLDAFPGVLGKDSLMTSEGWIIGYIATAFAASAGSSYWHDMLDRVRAMKSVASSARAVTQV